ncbi:MAG: hypothetical protein AVDCRST_MAG52-3599, partial [uncultured Blastococcus sp.]
GEAPLPARLRRRLRARRTCRQGAVRADPARLGTGQGRPAPAERRRYRAGPRGRRPVVGEDPDGHRRPPL